jgi:hypothetical protein
MIMLRPFFLFLFIALTILFDSYAQVSSLPYAQGFSGNFNTGNDIEFIPNWYGNEVETDRRIFQATLAGNPLLGIIPTSAFNADVQLRLNLVGYELVSVSFKATAAKNGDGTRSAVLFMETSVDGGTTWISRREVLRFANDNQAGFSNFRYDLPGAANNRNSVLVRFFVTRSESGNGTAPLVLIDDVVVKEEEEDLAAPEVVSINILDAQRIRIQFSEAMNATAENIANYSGVVNLTSANRSANNQQVTLNFSPDLGIGIFQTLRIAGVQDLAGNSLAQPFFFDFVYNPTTPDLIFTEIMYNPPETNTDSLEFLEIYNRGNAPAQLGGLYFADGINFTFPTATLAPGAFYLLAVNARAARNQYGVDFVQWESGALNNAGETILIKNSTGVTIDSVNYSPNWGSNGDGSSLVLCDINSDNNVGLNWSQATTPVGPRINNIQVFAHPGALCPSDASPSIRFTETALSVLENVGSVSIEVAIINSNDEPSSVRIAIDPNSTATPGTDFNTTTSFPVTLNFEPGYIGTKSITLNIINDAVAEPIKKLILRMDNPVNAVIGSSSTYELTLIDNDQSAPAICINELMASNSSYQTDEFGEYDDWIEIYNPSGQPVNLALYYITDDPNNLTKYRFPVDEPEKTTIPANGFLVVWADNQSNQGALHTNFALSAAGEYVGLVMPNGTTIVDSVSFPGIASDVSYGRSNDCGSGWIVFGRPTLGASNLTSSVAELSSGRKLIAYPNPVRTDLLYLSEPVNYELYDIMGRFLDAQVNSNRVDVSTLGNGMYIIRTSEGALLRFVVGR